MRKTLLSSLIIISTAAAFAASDSAYRLGKTKADSTGPVFKTEFMTAARNRREAEKRKVAYEANVGVYAKNTVSILVINQVTGVSIEKSLAKQISKRLARKKSRAIDPNVIDVEIASAKGKLICRNSGVQQGAADDSFYTKFTPFDLKRFDHFTDNRKAAIFEFDPACFMAPAHEIRYYIDAKGSDGLYRYSSQLITKKLREAIAQDFGL